MQYKRLKDNKKFLKLFRKGKRVFSSCLTVVYTPCEGKTLMGIALSKKHGKAVKRNRVKRLIRAAFANNFDRLGFPCALVVLPKVCEEYSYREIEKSLLSCFRRMEK